MKTSEEVTAMATNDYHFITTWRVKSTIEEVSEVLGDAQGLMRWWPSVYLDVKVLEQGDERGLGKAVSLYTKGWLPYTLRWEFRVTDVQPDGFTLVAWGDFDGRGIWTFEQDGEWVNITYDWKIKAEKPLLRYFSFVMKPIFAANHRWAMAKGEQSLKLELARRHTASKEELALISAPPRSTPSSPVPLLLVTTTIFALLGGLLYMVVRLLTGD
jgi:polyketide cyclase/dehydrase/lipid transport protein